MQGAPNLVGIGTVPGLTASSALRGCWPGCLIPAHAPWGASPPFFLLAPHPWTTLIHPSMAPASRNPPEEPSAAPSPPRTPGGWQGTTSEASAGSGLCFVSCLPCREEQRSSVCRNLAPSPRSPATRKLLSKQEDAEPLAPRWHPLAFGAAGPAASSCISSRLSSALFSGLFSSFLANQAASRPASQEGPLSCLTVSPLRLFSPRYAASPQAQFSWPCPLLMLGSHNTTSHHCAIPQATPPSVKAQH